MNITQQLTSNPLVWLILCHSFGCYWLLFRLMMMKSNESANRAHIVNWLTILPALLTALPLLGLLGTIVGLLVTFNDMATGNMGLQQLLSSGIADALLTTKIGLLMVIPGWIGLSLLARKVKGGVEQYA